MHNSKVVDSRSIYQPLLLVKNFNKKLNHSSIVYVVSVIPGVNHKPGINRNGISNLRLEIDKIPLSSGEW